MYFYYVSKDEQIAQLSEQNSSLTSENRNLKWELSQLKKLIYGSKSERSITVTQDEDQLNLFGEEQQFSEEETQANQAIAYERKKSTQKHPGRHKLPTHLSLIHI